MSKRIQSKLPKGWWIVTGAGDRPGRCRTCGEELNLILPQPIPIFVAASREFVKIHLRCGPPPGDVMKMTVGIAEEMDR